MNIDFEGKNGQRFRIRNLLRHELKQCYEIQVAVYEEKFAESEAALRKRWNYFPFGCFGFFLLGISSFFIQFNLEMRNIQSCSVLIYFRSFG